MITGIGAVRSAVPLGEEAGVMCSGMRWGGRRLGGVIEEERMVMSGDAHALDEGGRLRFFFYYT